MSQTHTTESYVIRKQMDINSTVRLNNGIEMPWLGLGVFRLKEKGEVEKAVKTALQNGYRSIDTAAAYHNEEGVAKGILASGVPRSQIFLTTKIKNDEQGYQSAIDAFYRSLAYLKTDYLDLLLIHWPLGKKSLKTWKAMEELYEKGLVRAIGVSNFKVHHLEYLLTDCKVIPAVNQVEFHPRNSQPELLDFCRKNSIQLQAWSPLMMGEAVKIPIIQTLADKYKKTPAQILLRWDLQKEVVTIPKSGKAERIIANAAIFDFEIDDIDMAKINRLNKNFAIVVYRDRTIYLLQMLLKHIFNKELIFLLLKAFYKKVVQLITLNPVDKDRKTAS